MDFLDRLEVEHEMVCNDRTDSLGVIRKRSVTTRLTRLARRLELEKNGLSLSHEKKINKVFFNGFFRFVTNFCLTLKT